jgi:flavin reductase (DIM6/NTAB) family NADH-FMN oxidoreductase RutF
MATAEQPSPVDAKTFWRTLGERPIGMTIVTTQGTEGPAGFLGLSASHVSAAPPVMLVSIDQKTSALAAVLQSRVFGVSFLPATAGHVPDDFSGKSGLSGAARFRDGEWTTLETGAPIFRTALGAFDCRVIDVLQHGNTSIILGSVTGALACGEGDPLVFFRGRTRADLKLG